MTCKKFCIRRIGACIACLVLVINLVCTSYTRVQAAPVAGAYALEEVVAALLVSLGITSATGEALNKAGLTPENARTIINSVYASAKEFSHDTDEIINETIENAVLDAMETGKLIFKQGSQAWNALKAWAKSVGAYIKNLTVPDDNAVLESYYNMSNVCKYPYADIYSYCGQVLKGLGAQVGEAMPYECKLTDSSASSYISSSFAYYMMFVVAYKEFATSDTEYRYFGIRAQSYEELIARYNGIKSGMVKEYEPYFFGYSVWSMSLYEAYSYYDTYWSGKLVAAHILSPSEMNVIGRYGTSDLAMSDAYQTVYNPAIPDTTDVVTPSNTITREKDDSVAVAGDYVIDVALPVAFPVDLTKGIVIDRDIPIEDAIDRSKTDDKTDDKEDDKNKPVIPDVPGTDIGADLTADLKSIFPFCIPFDLIACIKGLVAEGEPPKWVIKIPMPLDYTWTIVVDMADFDGVVKIFRAGEDILFIVGLIMITRSLMIRG